MPRATASKGRAATDPESDSPKAGAVDESATCPAYLELKTLLLSAGALHTSKMCACLRALPLFCVISFW